LGIYFFNIGDLEAALKHLRVSFKIKVTQLNPNHIEIAKLSEQIAIVYERLARPSNALDYFQRTLKIYTKLYGENSV
jgi:tetratricopeptide (TPR) repeat protein